MTELFLVSVVMYLFIAMAKLQTRFQEARSPFTMGRYKEDLGKPYSRITLYLFPNLKPDKEKNGSEIPIPDLLRKMEEDEIASIERELAAELEKFESIEVQPVQPHENETLSLAGEKNSSHVQIIEDNLPIPYTLTDFL